MNLEQILKMTELLLNKIKEVKVQAAAIHKEAETKTELKHLAFMDGLSSCKRETTACELESHDCPDNSEACPEVLETPVEWQEQ
jgi:hypothetical protein